MRVPQSVEPLEGGRVEFESENQRLHFQSVCCGSRFIFCGTEAFWVALLPLSRIHEAAKHLFQLRYVLVGEAFDGRLFGS